MVEYEIELPVVAIFRIMQIIDDKGKGKANSKDYKTAVSLYQKIEITDEERERKFQFKDRSGEDRVNVVAIKEAEPRKFILDFREIERLEKFLEEVDLSPSESRLWYEYVMKQLENARKPDLDDEKTKTERLANRGENSQKRVSTP